MRPRARILRPDLDPVRPDLSSGNLRCRSCGRPDGVVLRGLPDGRWWDGADQTWRDDHGRHAAWPSAVEYGLSRDQRVSVEPVRFSDLPGARPRLLCGRCRRSVGTVYRIARTRIRSMMRRALGDLFLGPYDDPEVVERLVATSQRRKR